MKNRLIILLTILLGTTSAFAQKEVRKEIRAGNKDYRKERYAESEIKYRKALESNAQSAEAAYNLGNSLYRQNKAQEAAEQYQAAIQGEKDKGKLSMAWHNMGNIFMAAKDYPKSIEAYKQALRNNPADDETRYNLALAQKLLSDQQQDQDQNQDQNKDQDKQEDKKDDQKEQEQKQDQQDQKQDQQQQQQQQDQMNKDNAEQILESLMQNEKQTQENAKKEEMKQVQRKKTSKNW